MSLRHIWILNHYAQGPEYPGGTRHYTLARHLAQRGYDVTVFASDFHYALHRQIRLLDGQPWGVEMVDGVRFVWLHVPAHQVNDSRRIRNMLAYMRQAMRYGPRLVREVPGMEPPDVIIGSSVHLFAVFAAWWLARRFRARFIMEVRDLWPQTLIDMGALRKNHPLTWLLRGLERFLYHRADRIISLLPYAFRYIERCGVPADKVVWIPNGVDLTLYPTPAPPPAHAQGEPFVLMYTGAHGIANHLGPLVEAARLVRQQSHSNMRYVLIGNGPLKAELQVRVRELGLEDCFEFRDPVPKNELPGWLARADATLLIWQDIPLYRYGISPNKLYDYMAAARPVLMAGASVHDPVGESHCGISTPESSPEAIAQAIIALVHTPYEERLAMGQRARAYVERQHSFVVLTDHLESLIKNL